MACPCTLQDTSEKEWGATTKQTPYVPYGNNPPPVPKMAYVVNSMVYSKMDVFRG